MPIHSLPTACRQPADSLPTACRQPADNFSFFPIIYRQFNRILYGIRTIYPFLSVNRLFDRIFTVYQQLTRFNVTLNWQFFYGLPTI